MEIVIAIFVIVGILILMSIGGYLLKGIEALAGIFFEGVGSCLGCLFKAGIWIIIIIVIIMAICGL